MRRFVALLVLLSACTSTAETTTTTPTTTPTPPATTTTGADTPQTNLPAISNVTPESESIAKYDKLELVVALEAEFDNPFDQRDVALDAVFTGPDGSTWEVPGFWDAHDAWRFRFTPNQPGEWSYEATVADRNGTSEPWQGSFAVSDSDHRGWLQVGSWVDPSYSDHYFAFTDGTPWYGFGHANLQMSLGGYTATGFRKINEMKEIGENFEMWWPQWSANFLANAHDDYAAAQMDSIDLFIREAEANGITFAYTIWIHQLLRTNNHPWQKGKWLDNGFSQIVSIDQFFVDGEAWAWQENYYRYTIARWGYSTAIGMWQTVTEINGTESYGETDPWHAKVNAYFQDNDPYRHPTTATKSGGEDWPTAHAVMDVPQMHVYEEFHQDPLEATEIMARWTALMFSREDKPNWIGEYGIRGQMTYPDTMHNSNWVTLATGAATTPIEWNDGTGYGSFDDEMAADMARFVDFVDTLPLVRLNPEVVTVSTSDESIRGWGVAGRAGGVVWVQDFALQGAELETIMSDETVRSGVAVTLDGELFGDYLVRPYNTWTGQWLEPIEMSCTTDCRLTLPDFVSDLALRIESVTD